MPWEFVEPPPIGVDTGKLIAQTLPPSNRRAIVSVAVVVGALILGLITSLLWLRADAPVTGEADEVVSLVPPPPARHYAPMPPPKVTPVKKVITKTTARKAVPPSKRDQAAEWASPFERRH